MVLWRLLGLVPNSRPSLEFGVVQKLSFCTILTFACTKYLYFWPFVDGYVDMGQAFLSDPHHPTTRQNDDLLPPRKGVAEWMTSHDHDLSLLPLTGWQ